MTLSPKIRQQLKAKAHKLKPIVLLGNQGLTDAVKKEIDHALTDHELIKIRIPVQDRDERKAIYNDICTSLNAEPVQAIGHIAVIYRQSKE